MLKGTCRIHGAIDDTTGFKYKSKSAESGYRLKCQKCFDDRMESYRQSNIDIPKPEDINGYCRKHGNLDNETGFVCLDKTLPLGYRIRCKECSHRIQTARYIKKHEEIIEKVQDWRKKNRGKINAQVREDRKNNPEKYKKWSDKYKEKNRDKMSLNQSLRAYGIGKDFYDKMMQEQDGKCALCKQEETRMARDGKTITRLCIDHDHDTNSVRALLCHDCNSGLGKFKDCPELLMEAAYYLVDHKGWTE